MIAGFWEKLGFWSKDLIIKWKSKSNWIWFHAVSVGELNAIWPLILEINKYKAEHPIMISCTTYAGYNLAKELNSNHNFLIFYFPFDIPAIIKSLLRHAKVKLLIITETEIWPSILKACNIQDIPVLLVNARLSDKSFENYRFFKFYFSGVINLFTKIISQSESDTNKFIELGLKSEKIKTLGNLKFAKNNRIETNNGKETIFDNKNTIKIIFASTHSGEEEIAINLFTKLLNEFKNIRLIIAPRHINRVNEIIKVIKKYGYSHVLKTDTTHIDSPSEIFILNTIGELQHFYKYSDITVLGGTFAQIGGHNILEPIRAKSYLIIGPNDYKIRELTRIFKKQNAIVQVTNENELYIKTKEAILNKDLRKDTIERGIKIIKENENILEETTKYILEYI